MQSKSRKKAEASFIALLKSIADPAAIIDGKSRFLVVNDALLGLGGLKEKDLIGKSFLDLSVLNAENKARIAKKFEARLEGLPVEPYEVTLTGKNGEVRSIEITSKKIDYFEQLAFLVVIHDITERKARTKQLEEYSEKMETLVNEKVEEIEESEKKYRELINRMNDSVWVIDFDSKFIDMNDAAVRSLGYSREELLSMGPQDIDDSLDAEQIKRFVEQASTQQTERIFETEHTTKDGQKIPVEISSSLVTYQGKQAFLSIARDITERKKAEEALKISEEKYRELINGMNDTAWVIDLDAKFIDVNDAAVRVLGYSREELLNMGPLDIDSSLTKGQILNLIGNMPADQIQVFETSHTTKDGRKIPVEISSSLVTYQGKQAILSIARDISERKKAAAKLSESEDKYHTLVDQSLQGILIAHVAPFRFVFANKPAVKILGYTVDELKSLSSEDTKGLVHPADLQFVLESFRKGLLGEKVPQRFDFRVIKKNGAVCWVAGFLSLTAYGGETAVQVIFVDITDRKQLENQLRASEEMFRAISTSAMDAIILLDERTKITYWNPAAERIFGYTNSEALGKPLDTLIIPEKYKGLHSKSAMKSVKNGQHHKTSMEFKALRKNGQEVPIELSISMLKLKDKKHLLGIIRDTSERKKMETTLREAEKRYHALFSKAPLGILLLDETATAIEFNEEAYRQLGYTREEFAKLTVSDYEVIETPEETKARIKKIMREGKDEFETKHRTKNGEIRDVIISVQVIELAGKKLFHLISKDVTEQKKIERELKIEKDKLEAVTENIGAGVAIISKDYRILWVNKLLKQINGECEGKICYSTFNNLTKVCPDCGVKKVFDYGVPIDIHEYSNVDDKGNRFWVELIVTPIKDENGNVIAALELAVNITERKIMENKLAEYSQKLEKLVEKKTAQLKQAQAKLVKSERLATIGELAAMVGHDLRNPLTGIVGAAYYLKTKHSPELGPKGKEMLETIENAITYSNKIVNDLLEYSRDLKLELEEGTPKMMLENALSLLKVPEKIKIVDATEDKPTIKADAEKMQRVFVNLIRNAFDAMPDGGTLTVKSKEVNGKLEISFKDTGTGMSKETLSKLKGDVLLFTTKAKGMGFGVPICKRIAEAHDGKLSVESKVGKGTVITLTLPVNPEPENENDVKLFFNHSMLETLAAKQKAKQTSSP
jgi:PAS domain S-box-containing protein